MEKPMSAKVGENNVVEVLIAGDLLDAQIEGLVNSIAEVTQIIADAHNTLNKKVKVLVDLSGFTGKYTPGSLVEMVKFAIATKPHIEKSAVFTQLDVGRMAAEIVGALSNRDNIKAFNTKEEALEWLGNS